MKHVALLVQFPPPSTLGVICVVNTGCVKTVEIGTEVSIVNVGAVTFSGGSGVAVAGAGDGVAVGGGVGAGEAVGAGVGVAGAGVAVGPVIVMLPLVCDGDKAFRSVSMNSKSFGFAFQTSVVLAPPVQLTLRQRVLKRTPDPLSGVTPSLTKADMRKVLSVPGPVLRVFDPTVQPLAVSPAP